MASPPRLLATRLLDQVRERLCYAHYGLSTERAHVYWIRWFLRFHRLRHYTGKGTPRLINLRVFVPSCFAIPVSGEPHERR